MLAGVVELSMEKVLCFKIFKIAMTTFKLLAETDNLWKLKKTMLSEVPVLTCANKFSWTVLISEAHLCAKDALNENAICSDSGGGFLGTSVGGYHVVHGIESFRFEEGRGSQCNPNQLSVFSRVASHVDWIEKTIANVSGK